MTIRHIGRALTGAVLVFIATSTNAQAQINNVTLPRIELAPSTPAAAPATVRERPLLRWSGVYFGGTAGFGGGNADTSFVAEPNGPPFAPDTISPTTRGGALGVYGGVNFQAGIFVSGIDADIMFSAMDGSADEDDFTFGNVPVDGSMSATQKIDWYSTVRGRAGIGVGGMLWYGTAGIVVERLEHSSNVSGPGVQYPVNQVDNEDGWTAGVGMEGRFGRIVTWRVQYLYLDLGSSTATGDPVPANPGFTIDHTWISTSHVFSAGIGFKF